jgi:hypothetical protein
MEQRGVSFLRVFRLPAFVPQELQKIFDQIFHARILKLQAPTTKLQ